MKTRRSALAGMSESWNQVQSEGEETNGGARCAPDSQKEDDYDEFVHELR